MDASALWRRLDVAGHDAAQLTRTVDGWRLRGTSVFAHQAGPACVNYAVAVDAAWRTRWGTVDGWLAERRFAHVIVHAPDGWYLDGALCAQLEHLTDLDYGFTPATNLLQMRRIDVCAGQSVDLPVAWFDVGATTLTELPQHYRCITETTYEYAAPTVGYRGRIELRSRSGFIKVYPGLWEIAS